VVWRCWKKDAGGSAKNADGPTGAERPWIVVSASTRQRQQVDASATEGATAHEHDAPGLVEACQHSDFLN
jgi:hypothetical protein